MQQRKPAVYAGSFDPVTCGHLDIIRRSARLFGGVRVVVCVNGSKKPLFSLAERAELLRQATADIAGVEVCVHEGLLVDYLQENGLTTLIRGIRSPADVQAEDDYAQINRLLMEEIEVVWLPAAAQWRHISSSAVREIFSYGKELPDAVPPVCARALRAKFPSAKNAASPKDPKTK